MTTAEMLTKVAENRPKLYEAGKQAEYDRFWDIYQNGGEPSDYTYKFASETWTDETYNPKYEIITLEEDTSAYYVFFNSKITNTKVPITHRSAANGGVFLGCSQLVTIPSLTVTENVTFVSWFSWCSALKNITMHGTIANDFDIHYSPLTKASFESIVSALSQTVTGKTITFSHGAKVKAFTDDEWNALIATRQNWTFKLS